MMIAPMKPRQTLKATEIQDGDIICFQKALSPSEYEFIALRFHYIDLR
jgi:ubiquitin carboxyl-terminal hydrolase 7